MSRSRYCMTLGEGALGDEEVLPLLSACRSGAKLSPLSSGLKAGLILSMLENRVGKVNDGKKFPENIGVRAGENKETLVDDTAFSAGALLEEALSAELWVAKISETGIDDMEFDGAVGKLLGSESTVTVGELEKVMAVVDAGVAEADEVTDDDAKRVDLLGFVITESAGAAAAAVSNNSDKLAGVC